MATGCKTKLTVRLWQVVPDGSLESRSTFRRVPDGQIMGAVDRFGSLWIAIHRRPLCIVPNYE